MLSDSACARAHASAGFPERAGRTERARNNIDGQITILIDRPGVKYKRILPDLAASDPADAPESAMLLSPFGFSGNAGQRGTGIPRRINAVPIKRKKEIRLSDKRMPVEGTDRASIEFGESGIKAEISNAASR